MTKFGGTLPFPVAAAGGVIADGDVILLLRDTVLDRTLRVDSDRNRMGLAIILLLQNPFLLCLQVEDVRGCGF